MTITTHRFTTSEYRSKFDERDGVELIDGQIYDKVINHPPHTRAVNRLARLFYGLPDVEVSVQNPVRAEGNEPEPDLALFRVGTDLGELPANHCLLVVEVSHTTLRYDREIRLPNYLAMGIPEIWIVNLIEPRFEIYPGDRFDRRAQFRGLEIDVRQLL